MPRFIDADLIEYHEEYDGRGFTRVAYADDIENLPTVELIDKGRLKFVIEKNFGHGTIEPILQLIDRQPTSDVVEVMHGKWEVSELGYPYCSKCGTALTKSAPRTNYCSCCGAKMDERRTE